MIQLDDERRSRAERFLHSARDFRGEMSRLCGDLEEAVERLEEARSAVTVARERIAASRAQMERVRGLTRQHERRRMKRRLRVVRA